jgi:hypothetical protein
MFRSLKGFFGYQKLNPALLPLLAGRLQGQSKV